MSPPILETVLIAMISPVKDSPASFQYTTSMLRRNSCRANSPVDLSLQGHSCSFLASKALNHFQMGVTLSGKRDLPMGGKIN